MQITTEIFGNVLVAHTPDELTEETSDQLRNALEISLEKGQKFVVLQMDRSDLFDSAGLSALLDIKDLFRENQGNVKLSALNETGRRILEVTRLNRQFDVFESVIDAVASYH